MGPARESLRGEFQEPKRPMSGPVMSDVAQFREVFARYPAGVVIVTTRDADGTAKGFTASSFTSVSAKPPLVLACLNLTAECYPTFKIAEKFAISILRPHHAAQIEAQPMRLGVF